MFKEVQISFYNRFCKFITNCLCSKNSIVKTVSNVAINNPYSSCCSNYQKLFNRDSTCKILTFMDEWFNREKASEATNIQVKELITVSDGLSYVPGFSIEEVTDLLTILCIMWYVLLLLLLCTVFKRVNKDDIYINTAWENSKTKPITLIPLVCDSPVLAVFISLCVLIYI